MNSRMYPESVMKKVIEEYERLPYFISRKREFLIDSILDDSTIEQEYNLTDEYDITFETIYENGSTKIESTITPKFQIKQIGVNINYNKPLK